MCNTLVNGLRMAMPSETQCDPVIKVSKKYWSVMTAKTRKYGLHAKVNFDVKLDDEWGV